MKFIYKEKVDVNSTEALRLRKIISEWANNIPYHEYYTLGDDIDISEITYCPSYEIKLQTQFYNEYNSFNKRPYKNERLNTHKQIVNPKISFGQILNKSLTDVIPGSEELFNCSTCSGKGTNTCNPCNGHGDVTCGSCSGSGKNKCSYCDNNGKKDCGSCYGDGRVKCGYCYGYGYKDVNESRTEWDYKTRRNITVNAYVRKTCSHCNSGKVRCKNIYCSYGKVQCSYCSGRAYNDCYTCGRSGRVTCGNCNGNGQVTCNYCNGTKKEIHYNEKTRSWYCQNQKVEIINPLYDKEQYPYFKILPKFSRKSIHNKIFEKPDVDWFNSEPNYVLKPFQRMISKSITSVNNNNKYPELLHQNLSCFIISIYKISYTFENEDYTMLVLDKEETVYEEYGPIENMRLELKAEGLRKLKLKNYSKGKNLLNKSFDMDPDDFDEDIIKLVKKADTKIKSSYLIGSFIGSFIWGYISTLLFLANRQKIELLFNKSSPSYSNQELVLVGATFFIITLILYRIIHKNRLAKWLYGKYENRLSPEITRIALGALSSLPSIIIASIITILAHQIGAIEFAGKGLWLIYEAISKLL